MQITRTFLLVWVLAVLGLGIYARDNVAAASIPTNAAFEKLKTLAGTWETKTPEGKSATETVQLMSGDSALMVTMNTADGENMVTMFSPDGDDSVIATHYCAAKNQPRYVLALSKDPNVLAFQFKNITNLSAPEAGHMHGLVIHFKDADHHTEEWTWRENGKESVHAMEFVRKN
jgi:hypothetical protein